jgi:hypothetical protein
MCLFFSICYLIVFLNAEKELAKTRFLMILLFKCLVNRNRLSNIMNIKIWDSFSDASER